MTGQVVLILVCVVGVIVVFGVLTQVMEGAGRGWRELAAQYPAQGAAPDATRGEAKIAIGHDLDELRVARGCLWIFMPWTWWRGMRQVRYAVDDEYLHLETEGGRLAPRSAASIPWGVVDIGQRIRTHMGEHVVLRIGDLVVLFPSAAVERELEVRATPHAGMDEDSGQQGVKWTEDV